jgi:hypothetical protein
MGGCALRGAGKQTIGAEISLVHALGCRLRICWVSTLAWAFGGCGSAWHWAKGLYAPASTWAAKCSAAARQRALEKENDER